MTCWIGVMAAEHAARAVEGGFAMFAHGKHEAAKRVGTGDWVAIYAPREQINAGEAVRAFVALGQAVNGDLTERLMAPGVTGWQRPMIWLDVGRADVYPLLDRFSFVVDRSHWGMYFRKSLFKISDADFALIAAAMGVGDTFKGDE